MKFYDADKLFIGFGGHARSTQKENEVKFWQDEIVIVNQNKYSLDCEYLDIFSNKEYIYFYHRYCIPGDSAIINVKSLSSVIRQVYNKTQDNELINKIAKKIIKEKKVSEKDLKSLLLLLNNQNVLENNNQSLNDDNSNNNNSDNKSNQNINTDYSTILTEKIFKNEPAIGRDNEVNELIITLAQDKKNPILVGPSGTGKTTIVDELAYKIQENKVPDFLKNRKIIEFNLTNLLAGTKYSGTLEEKFKNLINLAIKENAIIFIDEIHTIYGAGTHNKSDYDVAAMIKQAIDRQGLKVIGTTTTEEYDKYFSNDALKRRFEKVLVSEPTDEILYQIINKIFNDYSKNNNIELLNDMNNIICTLIKLTNSKNRSWNDKVYNPDLVIGIIDRIFADAKVNDQDKLTIHNIIYGINSCNRVYDSSKEKAISNLYIDEENKVTKTKIIKLKQKN